MDITPGTLLAPLLAQAEVAAATGGTHWIITLLAFLVMLGILVFFHELGHFLVAIWMGIRVEEFAIGFPPRAVTLFEHRGVKYTLNWLPLGGFVRFGGEDNVIYGTGSLAEARPWRKIPVMAAGPLMNLLLGILIFAALFATQGIESIQGAQVNEVIPDTPAETAGFESGDRLVRLAGQPIDSQAAVQSIAHANPGTSIEAEVQRDGETVRLDVTPSSEGLIGIRYTPLPEVEGIRILRTFPDTPAEAAGFQPGDVVRSLAGEPLDTPKVLEEGYIPGLVQQHEGQPIEAVVQRGDEQVTLTVTPDSWTREGEAQGVGLGFQHQAEAVTTPLNPLQALVTGTVQSVEIVARMMSGLIDMLRSALGLTESAPPGGVAGPIGIARATGEVIDMGGWFAFFRWMALLSINLFLLNLLPIPALDGSHIVFSLIEWVRGGKKVPPEKEALVHMIGFATLMGLMVLVSVSDVLNAIRGTSVLGGG